jgi:hypothetical protein
VIGVRGGRATVAVEATGRPIVLALSGYGPVRWELRLARGVRLHRVILCGIADQDVTGVPAGVPVTRRDEPGRLPLDVFADRRETVAFTELESRLRELTGLPVATFQARRGGTDESFVVGPRDRAWAAQQRVADLRPLYRRAARLRRDAVQDELAALRFTAVWRDDDEAGEIRGQALARFDVAGPITSSMRPFPSSCVAPTYDPRDRRWLAVHVTSDGVGTIDEAGNFCPAADDPLTVFRTTLLAFDTRRRRLMMLARFLPARSVSGGFYWLESGRHAYLPAPAVPPDYDSITYSDVDDCYYALGWSPAGSARLPAITRVDPDGQPGWRIPVNERVTDNQRRGPAWRPQIAAAGKYLVILTPPLPDPLAPDEPPRPRCVVLDPATNTILYSGPTAPHAGS